MSVNHNEGKHLFFTFVVYLHTKICETVITSHVKHTLQGHLASLEQEVHTNCIYLCRFVSVAYKLITTHKHYPRSMSQFPHMCVVQLHQTALVAVDYTPLCLTMHSVTR